MSYCQLPVHFFNRKPWESEGGAAAACLLAPAVVGLHYDDGDGHIRSRKQRHVVYTSLL